MLLWNIICCLDVKLLACQTPTVFNQKPLQICWKTDSYSITTQSLKILSWYELNLVSCREKQSIFELNVILSTMEDMIRSWSTAPWWIYFFFFCLKSVKQVWRLFASEVDQVGSGQWIDKICRNFLSRTKTQLKVKHAARPEPHLMGMRP